MFMAAIESDGRWWVVERYDTLEQARQEKSDLNDRGEHAEVLVRTREGYFIVQDDGNSVQLSQAKGA